MRNTKGKTGNIRQTDTWLFILLFFVLSFAFFSGAGNYILFFQEQHHLFVYLSDYLRGFLSQPGGPVDMTGKFLTQFYYLKLPGAFILSLSLTAPGVVLYFINRKLNPGTALEPSLVLFPPLLLLLMQSHYYHSITYNLGYLCVLTYFLAILMSGSRWRRILFLLLFPLFYYLAGFYAFVFTGLYIFYSTVYGKGIHKLFDSLFVIAITLLTLLFSSKYVFLYPLRELLSFPMPSVNNPVYRYLTVLLTAYFVFYPLFAYISHYVKVSVKFLVPVRAVPAIILFLAAGYTLYIYYNPDMARVINMERFVFEERWDEAVSYHEKNPSRNLIGQYFYNVALTETNQLCDRMFTGRQDFAAKSLFLPWDEKHLNWGSQVFYSLGLINEAHRWAYEEMVVYGLRPQNLKMLVRTNLINGNFTMAGKYTGILKETFFYRKWAEEYEKLLGDTAAVRSHYLLGKKTEIFPGENFFIFLESPQDNLPLLVETNPKNKRAFEYLMAWLLLHKDVETAVKNIPMMRELGYERIPLHIEEAVMIFYNSTGRMPELAGLSVSIATRERFSRYVSAYSELRKRNALKKENLQLTFGNTYWFYYHFNR